jgi:hypothetical protein
MRCARRQLRPNWTQLRGSNFASKIRNTQPVFLGVKEFRGEAPGMTPRRPRRKNSRVGVGERDPAVTPGTVLARRADYWCLDVNDTSSGEGDDKCFEPHWQLLRLFFSFRQARRRQRLSIHALSAKIPIPCGQCSQRSLRPHHLALRLLRWCVPVGLVEADARRGTNLWPGIRPARISRL